MDYFVQHCELSNLHVFLSLERYMGLEYKAYYIVVCQLHFSLLIKFFRLNKRYYCHIAIHVPLSYVFWNSFYPFLKHAKWQSDIKSAMSLYPTTNKWIILWHHSMYTTSFNSPKSLTMWAF